MLIIHPKITNDIPFLCICIVFMFLFCECGKKSDEIIEQDNPVEILPDEGFINRAFDEISDTGKYCFIFIAGIMVSILKMKITWIFQLLCSF